MSVASLLQFYWLSVAQIRPENAYQLGQTNHGFTNPAENAEYDSHMRTCHFFYNFWAEVTEARKFLKRNGDAAQKVQDMADLKAAVVAHYTTNLSFLPKRRTFGSISDLTSVPANKMQQLKAANRPNPLALNDWDQGFPFWQQQNRMVLAGMAVAATVIE